MPSLGSHEQHLPLTSDKLKQESTIVHTEEPICCWAYLQRMGEGMLAGGWVTLKQSHWHVFTQHWALRASTYRTDTTSQTNTPGRSENPAYKVRSSKGRNDSGVVGNSSERLMTQHPILPWGNIKTQQVQFGQTLRVSAAPVMKMGLFCWRTVCYNSLNIVLWTLSTMEGGWWEPLFSLMEQKGAVLTTKSWTPLTAGREGTN